MNYFLRSGLIVLCAIAGIAVTAQAQDCRATVGYRVVHVENRVVAVWYPAAERPSQFHYTPRFAGLLAKDAPPTRACGATVPLVVFSHGSSGCGIQAATFTEELARHGYVVAAPDHADAALCHIVPLEPGLTPTPPVHPQFAVPEDWNDASLAGRREDVEVVLETLLKDPKFSQVIDLTKIGLAGHSLGGYTVVGMAGTWPSWLDPRVRAVLAFSPYVMPFQTKRTLGNVRVPLMYQGGTLDTGITPFLQGSMGAYASANPPAFFLVLRGAGHLAWVNCGKERTTGYCLARVPNERLIAQYGIEFFDRYLKGIPEPLLEDKNPRLAEYHFRTQP